MTVWERARARYAYPAVCLAGELHSPVGQVFETTRDLGNHLLKLLNSKKASEVYLGYASVIYWGHYASADGRQNPNRAMARAKLAIAADDQGTVRTVRKALSHLRKRRAGDAALLLCELPQLEFAFATKVCAFAAPQICGVADSVIAERFPRFGFQTNGAGYLKSSRANARTFDRYCLYLQRQAANLDRRRSRWRDRDGTLNQWQSVEVERALFASA